MGAVKPEPAGDLSDILDLRADLIAAAISLRELVEIAGNRRVQGVSLAPGVRQKVDQTVRRLREAAATLDDVATEIEAQPLPDTAHQISRLITSAQHLRERADFLQGYCERNGFGSGTLTSEAGGGRAEARSPSTSHRRNSASRGGRHGSRKAAPS